ncbi:MAG TPA: FAD-binding oxidoreductase [Gemmatimonadaceae bacterium]|nr:FAD-binding oxidoreductase [Gemmatimonadaceae bacterium]
MTAPTQLEEIRATVERAGRGAGGLRIAGRGSWLAAGGPVDAGETLSLSAYSGIVDYVPGDLTITVRAGTPLSAIAGVTREHGQWLPLDPAGSPDGTIGATVSTGSYGPLATAFGRPRDQVLGLEFVSGSGEIITVGSRVVKNVAGFDLVRLLVGSWGTLGVITQITLRLRARSEVERTAAIAAPARGQKLAAALSAVRAARLAPLALELLSPALSQRLGLGDATLLLARFGGNEDSVSAQMNELASLGEAVPVDDQCWEKLRAVDGQATGTVRFSTPLTDLPLVWDALGGDGIDGQELMRHATVMRGIVRCMLNGSGSPVAAIARAPGSARLIAERLDRVSWSALAPSPVSDPISNRVKQAFDPSNVLNPGIFGVAW